MQLLDEIEAKGFSVCDNFISISETETLLSKIKELQQKKLFKPAGIGSKSQLQTNTTVRSDAIFWLDKNDNFINSVFFKKTEDIITGLNRNFYLGINDYEFHFAHYIPGTFYKKHRDAFKNDDARKMSMILYLNPGWKTGHGGELKLYTENNELTIQPIGGRMVIFESKLEHEVLESKADRYSITGWLKSKNRSFQNGF